MWVVCDIETDGLGPTVIWVVVCKEITTGKIHVFRRPDLNPRDFIDYASNVTYWIGHNFLGYDAPVLNRLIPDGFSLPYDRVIDTLVVARLLNYNAPGGNSLDTWGQRLGVLKGNFKDFSELTDEMVDYCIQDVEVNYRIFKEFEPYINSKIWKKSLRCEHDMAIVAIDLHENGFKFDKEKADELYEEVTKKTEELTAELQRAFPPKSKLIREITPKATKHGTISKVDFRWVTDGDLTPYSVGSPFSLIEFVHFNPGSPKQVVERLNEAGWKPFEKTKGHLKCEQNLRRERDPRKRAILEERLEEYLIYGWSISEENLKTLPADAPEAARKLVEWLLINSRRSTLEEWFQAYNEETKRIHGRFSHIGAWTQRMSHNTPNMANIPAVRQDAKGNTLYGVPGGYGVEMRSLWTVPKGRRLLGVDADGIQLRILAHYINDPVFTKALLSGDKKFGTDVHSLNKKALGEVCETRDVAKTFIYAFLLGAGLGKIGQILSCGNNAATEARDNFLAAYPGLQYLKNHTIPLDADRGYFEGFDGRLVMCDSEHLMLAGYLQAGEACIMKYANLHWRKELDTLGIDYKQVNFVHDEWQTEIPDDDEICRVVADIQKDSIRIAAENFELNVPFAGNETIGYNWMETH